MYNSKRYETILSNPRTRDITQSGPTLRIQRNRKLGRWVFNEITNLAIFLKLLRSNALQDSITESLSQIFYHPFTIITHLYSCHTLQRLPLNGIAKFPFLRQVHECKNHMTQKNGNNYPQSSVAFASSRLRVSPSTLLQNDLTQCHEGTDVT